MHPRPRGEALVVARLPRQRRRLEELSLGLRSKDNGMVDPPLSLRRISGHGMAVRRVGAMLGNAARELGRLRGGRTIREKKAGLLSIRLMPPHERVESVMWSLAVGCDAVLAGCQILRVAPSSGGCSNPNGLD